ncbi:MAG: regulatory protein RecX [Pseudomonadota bacterium]
MGAATAAQVRRLAMDYLARREHGFAELLSKLNQRGVPDALAQETLQRLADEGLQDDARFGDMYTRAQSARGKGPHYIRNGLKARGLEGPDADAALRRADVDWSASAIEVARKKFPHGCADHAERAKGLRFLQQRGFNAEQSAGAIRALEQIAVDE